GIREVDDGSDLVCPNEFCGVRAVANLCHYLTALGVKGLAESQVGKMYDKGLVKFPSDFYDLKVADLEGIGFSKRQALLAVARIRMIDDPVHKEDDELEKLVTTQNGKLKVPAWQLFAALGIAGAGKSAGQAIVSHFGGFEGIKTAKLPELETVADVGTVTAASVHQFFDKYGDMVDKLLAHIEPQGPKKGKFTGKSFVFTGGFPGGKGKWEKEVLEQGGKCSGSVSKNTDY